MNEKHVIEHGAVDAITGRPKRWAGPRWMGWGWMCWDTESKGG